MNAKPEPLPEDPIARARLEKERQERLDRLERERRLRGLEAKVKQEARVDALKTLVENHRQEYMRLYANELQARKVPAKWREVS